MVIDDGVAVVGPWLEIMEMLGSFGSRVCFVTWMNGVGKLNGLVTGWSGTE